MPVEKEPLIIEPPGSKSWGDRFKQSVLNQFTYVALNFFVNLFGSAAFAYYAEDKLGDSSQQKADAAGTVLGNKIGIDPKRIAGSIFGLIRSFLLSIVGHALAPVIKYIEDHRQKFEFKIGHVLDVMQEGLGRGNKASRQNIADYHKIKQFAHDNSVAFSDAERDRMWNKHRLEMGDVSHTLDFKEHKIGWWKILFSRLGGWLAAEGTNGIMGFTKTNSEKWRYSYYEAKLATGLQKGINYLPGANFFKDKNKYATLVANDLMLSAVTAGAHKTLQGMMHHSGPEQIKHTEKSFATKARPPEEAGKDFRTRREEQKNREPEMAGQHYA